MSQPKILVIDVETAPLLNYCWGVWDQNVGLNQIKSDWHLLSFSAKWLGKKEVIYKDQRNAKNIEDDTSLLKDIWSLLDECDIVLTHNGKKFDIKKINARFIANGLPPPSSFRHVDTLGIARKHFAFTSNKLEFLTQHLKCKVTKLTERKFKGFDLWKECLNGNKLAWKEMEKYNKQDVLALEELYKKLAPWDNSVNMFVFQSGENKQTCTCGSTSFLKRGFRYTNTGKFQRYRCNSCSKEHTDGVNLLGKGQGGPGTSQVKR